MCIRIRKSGGIYERKYADRYNCSRNQRPDDPGKKLGQNDLPCGNRQGIGKIALVRIYVSIITGGDSNHYSDRTGCNGQNIEEYRETEHNFDSPR